MQFSPFPFLRWAIVLVLGIVAQDKLEFTPDQLWVVLGFGTSLYLWFWLGLEGKAFRMLNALLGLSSVLVIFSVGMHLRQWLSDRLPNYHLSKIELAGVEAYKGIITDQVAERPNWLKTELSITIVKDSGQWKPADGIVMAYFAKDSLASVAFGDEVLIIGKPFEPSPPVNPGQFDYKAYLARQGIHYQHFIKSSKFKVIAHNKAPNSFLAWAFEIRTWANGVLEKKIPTQRSYSIVAALTLGIKDALDHDLKEAYASAGAMHVLAVSGLHVGILVTILSWLFLRWKKHKGIIAVRVIASLTFLWTYALITGFSPSVLRAVTMFTFVLIGQLFGRRISIYNSLGLSAFVLLCWRPMMAFEVGFQLSYFAVIGIVYFQPKFYSLWIPPNKFTKWAWSLLCVSLAAQLATFPIGVFYFHQFPVLFWASNFLVIPMAILVLIGTILLLMFSWFGVLATWIGSLINFIVWLVNHGIFLLESLPFSVVGDLYTSLLTVVLSYAVMIFISVLFVRKRLVWLAMAVGCTAGILAFTIKKTTDQSQQQLLVIYKAKKITTMGMITGGEITLLSDSSLIHNESTFEFSINPHLGSLGVSKVKHCYFNSPQMPKNIHDDQAVTLISWQGKKIVLLKRYTKQFLGKGDLLILTNKSLWSLKDINAEDFAQIVLDGSWDYYRSKALKKEAEDLGISLYAVTLDGAFVFTVGN